MLGTSLAWDPPAWVCPGCLLPILLTARLSHITAPLRPRGSVCNILPKPPSLLKLSAIAQIAAGRFSSHHPGGRQKPDFLPPTLGGAPKAGFPPTPRGSRPQRPALARVPDSGSAGGEGGQGITGAKGIISFLPVSLFRDPVYLLLQPLLRMGTDPPEYPSVYGSPHRGHLVQTCGHTQA